MDKAVLESMAAGLLVIVSNEAFASLLGKHAGALMFRERDARDCADKMESALRDTERSLTARHDLVRTVGEMSIKNVTQKILYFYETSS